jgi:alkanesulfonate monooxygenase SsuD/methylene tetrahydromethanopterin reductase-like flavin-dependent oxidoreductase (luciferase family)
MLSDAFCIQKIMEKTWTYQKFRKAFEGKFWKLENCRNFPKPVQKPWPQIVVGANEE